MDEPIEWNNLEEAAAYLTGATGKTWSPRMVVSACLKHYEIGSHAKPRPSLLKAAPPIETPISVYRFEIGKGMVRKFAGIPPQLFPLYPAQLGDLLTRGKTFVGLARDPEEGAESEYVMADESTCVDLSQVGISRSALVRLIEIVSGNTDAAKPASAPAQTPEPALASKRQILEAFPPPAGVTAENWEKTLGDPPAWLIEARIEPGGRGVSSLWNPALFALCLTSEGKMKPGPLDVIIKRHFPEWLTEWEKYKKLAVTDRR